MSDSVKVEPGYYGLIVGAVYYGFEPTGRDTERLRELRSIVESCETKVAILPGDDAEFFRVVMQLPNNGIVVSLGTYGLRAETAGEAYDLATGALPAQPYYPVLVTWLETANRVMH